ncbi:MAG: RNA polymerase sigma factor [Acidobacteriota bacterium]|nr:MAG: RNA polymerase sigma factor [Acidobacteriota bacterium]
MGEWTQDDLEALYVRLEKPIYNVVYRRLWNSEEAHDVVQEAFLKLWSMRRRIVPETVEPLAYRIALNVARSRLRRRRVLRFLPIEAAAPESLRDPHDLERHAMAAEDRARLREAIDTLPADARDVLLLSVFGKLTYAAIARALAIPEGTVGSRRHRALRLLREKLEEDRIERRTGSRPLAP